MNYRDPAEPDHDPAKESANERAPIRNDTPPLHTSWRSMLLRLWFMKKITVPPRGNPAAAGVALSLLWLAAWVAIDRWQRQPAPSFYVDGIPLLAWYVLGVLGMAGLLRWRAAPRPALGATLVLVLGLVPFPLLLVSVAAYYLSAAWFWLLAALITVYSVGYLWRGMRAVTERPQVTATVLGCVFMIAFIATSDWIDAIPDVWNPRDAVAADTSDDSLSEREAALFEQADRIDEALESVQRDASPQPEAFFMGFAGVGDEKVFAQEIGLASRVIGERYGIAGRQISLVNDERDLDRAPLASVSGLSYALRGLAAHMQLDRDVLFLSISSHGSAEPVIAVSNSQFPFQDLTDQDLVEALHDSGVKWRVIIISACYAGGFIDSLRNPQTIVITAAAADRTSFGCSNDSDLTYFGEAFYRDALPAATSLRKAFEQAKAAIALREQVEGETPSNPQAFFGVDIEVHLAAMSSASDERPRGLTAHASGEVDPRQSRRSVPATR